MVVFGQMWFYSGSKVFLGRSGSIRIKVVVFGQKWFYSGKSCCIRAKVVVLRQK